MDVTQEEQVGEGPARVNWELFGGTELESEYKYLLERDDLRNIKKNIRRRLDRTNQARSYQLARAERTCSCGDIASGLD